MILEELVRYANDHQLIEVAGYSSQEIRWLVRIRDDGTLLNIEDTVQTDASGKPGRPMRFLAPDPPKRTVKISAQPLVDNAKYIFGIGDNPNRDALCAAAFRESLRSVVHATQDRAASAAMRFLERHDGGEYHNIVKSLAYASNDKFGFVLEPERLALHDPANAKVRAIVAASGDGAAQKCLICGSPGPVARLHPAIKGVPKTKSSGASLVSFNAASFTSFGLEQGDLASSCESCAAAYGAALAAFMLPKSGHALRLGKRTVVVFWTRAGTAEADPLFDGLLNGDTEIVNRIFASPQWGRLAATDPDSARFYALVLGGADARISVRSWHERTINAALEALKAHFLDLQLVDAPAPPSIRRLLDGLARPGGEAPEQHAAELVHAALYGTPYPLALLELALERLNADRNFGDHDRYVAAARLSLIKAVLRRLPGRSYGDLMPDLDPASERPSYRCGRLLAVLDHLQRRAVAPNAGVVDRYYGSASSAPATVFGTLLGNAQNHISKINDTYHNRLIGEILGSMRNFPKVLSLEERGLFALGYYHQRQSFFKTGADSVNPTPVPAVAEGQ
ncbi:MAG: type I-C CRISPR-associated protein Cas8c/Csd1 [Candidatus Velthaea sp.]